MKKIVPIIVIVLALSAVSAALVFALRRRAQVQVPAGNAPVTSNNPVDSHPEDPVIAPTDGNDSGQGQDVEVTGECGDGICQSEIGETPRMCPGDCATQSGVRYVQFVDMTPTSLVLEVATVSESTVRVRYGRTPSVEDGIEESSILTMEHSIPFTGLASGVELFFKVEITHANGESSVVETSYDLAEISR